MATADEVVSDCYLALIREFPLRRLRNETDLDRAIAMLDRLLDQGASRRSPEETDYMDVLSTLVEQYEDIHYPMGEQLDELKASSSFPADPPTDERVELPRLLPPSS